MVKVSQYFGDSCDGTYDGNDKVNNAMPKFILCKDCQNGIADDTIIDRFGRMTKDKCDNDTNICIDPKGPHCSVCSGKVARKPSITKPNKFFDRSEWIFGRDVNTSTPGKPENTNTPTIAPVASPTLPPCNYDLFITEIVQHKGFVKYIELKASNSCAYGRIIEKELTLLIKDPDNEFQPIHFRGPEWKFNTEGFLVICDFSMPIGDDLLGVCAYFLNDFESNIEISADKPMVKLSQQIGDKLIPIDVFGYDGTCIGGPNVGRNICLNDEGRVARRPSINASTVVFDPNQWIFKDITSKTPGYADPEFTRKPTRVPSLSPSVGVSICTGKGCAKSPKGKGMGKGYVRKR